MVKHTLALAIGVVAALFTTDQDRLFLPALIPAPYDTSAVEFEQATSLLAVSQSGHVALGGIYHASSRAQFAVINPSGKVVGRFGSQGEGPGELRAVAEFFITDSLVVAITRGPRANLFRLDGTFVSSILVGGKLPNGDGSVSAVGGDSADVLDAALLGREGGIAPHLLVVVTCTFTIRYV
jgi:hypothetical protein